MRFKHDFAVVKRALSPWGDVAIEICRIPSLDTPNQIKEAKVWLTMYVFCLRDISALQPSIVIYSSS